MTKNPLTSTATLQPNFELLKDAYAIIDGIPDKQFDLDRVVSKGYAKKADCNTIACAIGFLAMHPQFNALGLSYSPPNGLQFKGRQLDSYKTVISKVFGVSEDDARNLFGAAYSSDYDPPFSDRSHKKLWQHRVMRFLEKTVR
ncbi:hypothetical protein RGU72_04735 [Undibacterium sp. 5I1]|uniref:hypothetical protein n=1 Tax=unclassified Undibacterium TaxID=2630295 RepID=UPI002AB46E82|nr:MULTISPECIES: hypothetical protein [unclassified Undibacterium]MDY7537558.1 hypothetical protein [Undibacterium sp. 5I1]MEB0231943.1 hypothetical protein [Undibacterium sp. 10I3]MEB0256294.1 hypothetical protein [Undibacterium sp. 5I1]